ncbi:hypothetical protein V8E54_000391 [Elaphomyces granulatus]
MQAALGSLIGPKKELHDLEGRVALVTGGALGIGYEVSRAFASAKAKIIMVSRDEDQGSAAITGIKKDFGSDTVVEWIHCDLGNLHEIKDVFTTIREKEDRLDLLVLSAGINANKYNLDYDGIDQHFGVNWLGQFYATNLLFPLIRRTSKMPSTPAPRIIVESSELHRLAPSATKFDSLDDINNSKLGPTQLYGRSKLAMILGIKYGLLERVMKPNADNIYAIAVHPGAVNTAIQQQWKDAYPGLTGKLLTNASLAIGRSPEQGAFTTLYAATSPEIEEKGWNGAYLSDPGKLGKESSQASDPKLGASLWTLSEDLVRQKIGENALLDWCS